MKSREYKNSEKNRKEKTTWGKVQPGKRTADEEAALGPAEANADRADSDTVSSSNMDPEPREGRGPEVNGRTEDWQQLSNEEKERSAGRRGGYPKN